jgi:hypothetical protein
MIFEVEATTAADPWAVVGVIATVLVGVGALVAAVVVPIGIYRRQSPKRELWYSVSSYGFLSSQIPELSARITVHLDGKPLADPHVTTFRLWSTGRADIPSADFDGGKPLIFNLGTRFLSLVGQREKNEHADVMVRINESGTFSVGPVLLRRTYGTELRMVTDGPPKEEVVLTNPLVDIEVRRVEDLEALSRQRAKNAWVKLIVAGLLAVLATLSQVLRIDTPWSFLILVLLIASTAWASSDLWGNRATRLRKAFRRSM